MYYCELFLGDYMGIDVFITVDCKCGRVLITVECKSSRTESASSLAIENEALSRKYPADLLRILARLLSRIGGVFQMEGSMNFASKSLGLGGVCAIILLRGSSWSSD